LEGTTFSLSSEAPTETDRRVSARHIRILKVGSLLLGDRRELCLVRNISAGGLMAHVYSQLRPTTHIVAELKPGQPMPGRVVWVRESNIGMAFDEKIDVEAILSSQSVEKGQQPRSPRVEVDRLATVRCGARLYGASTVDISQGGVKLELDEPLDQGREVVLTLDQFRPLKGIVRWSHDGLVGVSFNETIPFRELMEWLKRDTK
jgi:hypothetical protein